MLCQFSAVKGSQMGRFTPIYLFIYLFIRVLLVYILLSSRFCCKMSRYSQLMPICTIMFNERLCLVALSEGLKIERWVPAGVTLLEAGEHPDSFNYWIQRDVSARIWYTTCSPPPPGKTPGGNGKPREPLVTSKPKSFGEKLKFGNVSWGNKNRWTFLTLFSIFYKERTHDRRRHKPYFRVR